MSFHYFHSVQPSIAPLSGETEMWFIGGQSNAVGQGEGTVAGSLRVYAWVQSELDIETSL